MPSLDLKVANNLLCQTSENGDQVSITISKYQKHPSIKANLAELFFQNSVFTDKEKEKNRLDTKKPSHSSDAPMKLLK